MKDLKHISKFLSLVLRHNPALIGLSMDAEGWVSIDELIEKSTRHGEHLTIALLDEVVTTSDKKRFAYDEDKTRIRANQGHSVDVDLKFEFKEPLEFLYHGTIDKFLDSIKATGLQKMERTHVHLSKDTNTAAAVGSRRGKAVILTIRAAEMHQDGFKFYLSANGVWLTNEVPAKYIDFDT
jgi:putative RNA 2'-phosphotransferase